MSAFDNATLMITGGTGSFGSTVLKHFLDSDLKEIRIFSRDEKKQDDMRHELQAKHPEAAKKVKFYIGDVRNPQSIKDAMPGVDYIFHAAALKQVPSCEFFPMQAVQTNIIGTDNVLHAAIDAGVKRVVCLSTDKAAYPINAMGISKAMMGMSSMPMPVWLRSVAVLPSAAPVTATSCAAVALSSRCLSTRSRLVIPSPSPTPT